MAFLIQERKACQPSYTHQTRMCGGMGWVDRGQKNKQKKPPTTTRKHGRCDRAGKKQENEEWMTVGSSERGLKVGFGVDAIQASFFFMTPGVECRINMVISPPDDSKCRGVEVIHCICRSQPGWAGWRSSVGWLGGCLRGSKGNGSQASLELHLQLTKIWSWVGGWVRGGNGLLMGRKTRECRHLHPHTHILLSINNAWSFKPSKHLWHLKFHDSWILTV